MMDRFLFCFIFLCSILVIPVYAADSVGGEVDGTAAVSDFGDNFSSSDPSDHISSSPDPAPLAEYEADISVLSDSGSLAGGYYFICDCVLGSGLKFYVPLEWAYDVFTYDVSGAPVNLSMNTCYAYCPDYPDYTFSCSRFSTFTYRYSGYSTTDLKVSNISDTNIQFLTDEAVRLSDSQLLVLIASLLFVLLAGIWILRKR